MGVCSSKKHNSHYDEFDKTGETDKIPIANATPVIESNIIDKFEKNNITDILKNFKPDHEIYHTWKNLYLWYDTNNINESRYSYEYQTIYMYENQSEHRHVKKDNTYFIVINLYYNRQKNKYYFVFRYELYKWGDSFAQQYDINNSFMYKIDTIHTIDACIEYFKQRFPQISYLKSFKPLLTCEYYNTYIRQ